MFVRLIIPTLALFASCSGYLSSDPIPLPPTEVFDRLCKSLKNQGYKIEIRDESAGRIVTAWETLLLNEDGTSRRSRVVCNILPSGKSTVVEVSAPAERSVMASGTNLLWLPDGSDVEVEEKILTIVRLWRYRAP